LASIYLSEFDELCAKQYTYFRYVDDILIICGSNDAESILTEVTGQLKSSLSIKCHGLSPSEGKTLISPVGDGVDYLGYHLTVAEVSVRRSSYIRMFENLMRIFTAHRYAPSNRDRFLFRLNLKIAGCIFQGKRYGWISFFSQTDNLRQLKRLDNFVRIQLSRNRIVVEPGEIKTFVRTHFETRYPSEKSEYVFNFDKVNLRYRIDTIVLLTGKTLEEVEMFTDAQIHLEFKKVILKEAHKLEQDAHEDVS
jgi:hypothetical protein